MTATPTPTATEAVRPEDRRRQVIVTASMVFCLVGSLFGVGVIGTRVEELSGGALAPDATLLAPARPAFSIWSVIYLGLMAYTLWQWLPAQASDRRHRAIGRLAAGSMVLNATWLLVTQESWIWVSVAVMALLVVTLGRLVTVLTDIPSFGLAETVIVDGTFGIYLGWVAVAAFANVTAALVASGVYPQGYAGPLTATVALAIAAGVGVHLARRLDGRWAVAGAMAWGLLWIAIARGSQFPESTGVALAAIMAAVVVIGATAQRRSALAA